MRFLADAHRRAVLRQAGTITEQLGPGSGDALQVSRIERQLAA
jgi:hypothetical protein